MVAHAMDCDVVVAAAEDADAREAGDVVLAAQRRLLHAVHLRPPPMAWLLCAMICQGAEYHPWLSTFAPHGAGGLRARLQQSDSTLYLMHGVSHRGSHRRASSVRFCIFQGSRTTSMATCPCRLYVQRSLHRHTRSENAPWQIAGAHRLPGTLHAAPESQLPRLAPAAGTRDTCEACDAARPGVRSYIQRGIQRRLGHLALSIHSTPEQPDPGAWHPLSPLSTTPRCMSASRQAKCCKAIGGDGEITMAP